MIETSAQLTPRESIMMEYEREENARGREFALAMKDRELMQTQLETKWASWLRIPLTVIKLPVLLVWALCFGIAYVVSVAREKPLDVGEMWKHI